ncbi:MAG: hypothetical protein ACK551_06885 [Vampirovibrionales bacterium]
MMTFSNINNSSANAALKLFKTDAAAAKVVEEVKSNDNVDLSFVEDTNKDDKLTKLELKQADKVEDMEIDIVVNVDDIKRKAREKGVKEDVFLSQQIASVMSASYLMLSSIKDGKDPSKYLSNGEFLVASNLLADGMVRRTNKDAIPLLDEERKSLAKRIKEEHGDIETGSSDAFELAEKLGFKGINTGGWGDKIVKDLGELSELDELAETDETDDDDTTVTDTDETAETDDDTTAAETEEEKKGFDWKKGLLWGGLGAGAGFLLSNLMKPKEKNNDNELAQLKQQYQVELAQQQAQYKAELAQQKAQQEYQAKLAAYQAQVAAAATPTPATTFSVPPYPTYTTASAPVVYSSTSSSTTPPTYVAPTVPTAPTSDWT